MKKVNTNPIDIMLLACEILDLDFNKYGDNLEIIEDALIDELNLDFDAFQEIVSRLLPLIDVGENPLNKIKFKGFSKIENGTGFWLIKTVI